MLSQTIHNHTEPFALKDLVCKQLCRAEHTTIKDVRHGCSKVYFNHNGAAIMRNENPPLGDNLFYSVALYHVDGRALSEEETLYVRDKVEGVLSAYGVKHSIACMDSHYDMLVARYLRISEGERGHPDTDEHHLEQLAHASAKRQDSGRSQISFSIPADAANVERLLQAMSEINTAVPDRPFSGRGC